MRTEPNLVSVIIPAYNAADWVNRAIDSALAQTYSQREVLVVNDGSTDSTAEVLAGYGDAIRVLSQSNGGLCSARNLGIKNARGEFLAFLDADDYWLPEKLARQVGCLQQDPDLGFCSTRTQVISPEGKPMGTWDCPTIDSTLLNAIFLRHASISGSGSGVMARSQLFDRAGMFDTELRSLEDVDMWMRLAAISNYACIDEPLTVIIKSSTSMSGNLDVMRQSAIQVMHKNRDLLPKKEQGRFWQAAYASMLADYAKWEIRAGRRGEALRHLAEAFIRSPIARGRLVLGIAFDALRKFQLDISNSR
ncbi:glycosyltransferase [Seongchinamella sediminis]|uniref:Glycosyltransferase n=2 Tax=Seongchinamella sediminis TaxID=2283635 RepID=A0A3L7DTH9_9GAMM|nr:glycosyltransferase [Seongchinamella sediminis]